MALGEYPLIGLAQARELHVVARKSLIAGTDPMAERKAEGEAKQKEADDRQREAEHSFENVAREWWKWWLIGKSPRHADTTMRRMEADVFPAYGHKPINAVTAADVRQLMIAVEKRDARDVAKRIHETTSQIFRFAIARDKHILIKEIFSSTKNKQLLDGALASIKTVRKNLGGVTMIGQSADDLGANADSIVNSCTSFLFLKDATFNRKRYAKLFKMNEKQIALFESLQDREGLVHTARWADEGRHPQSR